MTSVQPTPSRADLIWGCFFIVVPIAKWVSFGMPPFTLAHWGWALVLFVLVGIFRLGRYIRDSRRARTAT